jgi:hypothetical protein
MGPPAGWMRRRIDTEHLIIPEVIPTFEIRFGLRKISDVFD